MCVEINNRNIIIYNTYISRDGWIYNYAYIIPSAIDIDMIRTTVTNYRMVGPKWLDVPTY